MNKKILIVTGSDYTQQVYHAFSDIKALGHELYLLSDGSFSPKDGFFEAHYTYDLRRTREVLEFMRAKKLHFDAVAIKTSEWLTPLTALLCKEYACPGNTPLTAFICRSKYHMRRRLEEAALPIPKFRLARNFDELEAAVKAIGIPCVAKPVGGNASYGTFMLRDKGDLKYLRENYERSIEYLKMMSVDQDIFAFSPDEMDLLGVTDHVNMVTDYLVEEFMAGEEVSVDTISQNGKSTVMGIAYQERMKPPYFVQLAEVMPYVCEDSFSRDIESLAIRTVEALGITDGPAHTELMLTPEGLKIVETGCRIGGDNIHDAVYQTTGYNLMLEALMTALGERRDYDMSFKCHTAMRYILPTLKGTIKKVHVPQSVRDDASVTEIVIDCKAGDTVDTPPRNFDFLGYVQVRGETPELAKQNLDRALEMIDIVIEPS